MDYSINGARIIGYLCRKQSRIVFLIYTHTHTHSWMNKDLNVLCLSFPLFPYPPFCLVPTKIDSVIC